MNEAHFNGSHVLDWREIAVISFSVRLRAGGADNSREWPWLVSSRFTSMVITARTIEMLNCICISLLSCLPRWQRKLTGYDYLVAARAVNYGRELEATRPACERREGK